MKMKKQTMSIILILVILSIALIALFGFKTTSPEKTLLSDAERAKQICIQKCKEALSLGENLDNGPCLLNPISELKDWVCDVAHWPREAVDNLAENQCSSYRQGLAKHFVEVTPSCEFIRSY
jgi:hypothetical protein